MFGRVAFMELRTGWKGLLIFAFLILIIAAGMPQMYPPFRDYVMEKMQGANPVSIDVPEKLGGQITISWESVEGATSYIVLEDNRSIIMSVYTASIIYTGNETSYKFTKDFEEKRYYAVMAIINEIKSDPVMLGVISTEKGEDPFEEFFNNPAYHGFTGGRDISFFDVRGFIGVQFYSWWWILAGLFVGYLAVSTVTGDFEGRRMDLIFSTPMSQKRYILEKFIAMSIISLFLILVSIGGLIGGIESIGVSNEFSADAVAISLIACLPFLMFIAAFGILTAVWFKRTKTSIGITLAFVFAQFFIYTFSGFSEGLEWLKFLSIMNYWDYYSVIFDGVFQTYAFIGLFIASSILIGLTMFIFDKEDIPA